jgi:hypothetical protein
MESGGLSGAPASRAKAVSYPGPREIERRPAIITTILIIIVLVLLAIYLFRRVF